MKAKVLLCLAAMAGSAVYGQNCTTDQLRGSYGYLATFGVTGVPPGTNGSAPEFSSTPIGSLLEAIGGNEGQAAGSTLYFDGAGNIFGSSSRNSFIQFASGDSLGTYTISGDCTVRVDLVDSFAEDSDPATPMDPTSLVGLVVKGGNEIYLTQLDDPTTPPVNGIARVNQRVAIRLVRFSSGYGLGCTVSTLNGPYALIGEGYSSRAITGNPQTPGSPGNMSPYAANFLARVRFDGRGDLVEDNVSGNSPLDTFQFSGTYTVNSDCTGMLSISQPSDEDDDDPSDSPTPVTTVHFLITSPQGYVDNRGTLVGQNVQDVMPGLIFTIADEGQTISGIGVAQ